MRFLNKISAYFKTNTTNFTRRGVDLYEYAHFQAKMSLFQFRWLRAFIRRNTNHIPEERAHFWKRRLSLVYMFCAWNAFGVVLYNVYKGNSDWAKKYKSEEELSLTPAQQWSRTLGIKDAKVIRISGLEVTDYEIHNEGLGEAGNEAEQE